jgi:hypothetical protein
MQRRLQTIRRIFAIELAKGAFLLPVSRNIGGIVVLKLS